MTATTVKLPDGTEQDAHDVICAGCDQPMSDHSCGGSVTITSGPATPSRSTGPRKKPSERPPCPHCGGAIHFSMPGGLQNTECAMRQYYLDTKVISDPNDRLPLYGLDEIALMINWSKTLATPISYGRMESAAGGAGTYAATKPKLSDEEKEKRRSERKKKVAPAAAGEKIEDLTGEVELEDITDEDFTETTTDEKPVKKGKKSKSKKHSEGSYSTVLTTTSPAEMAESETQAAEIQLAAASDAVPAETAEQERDRKRAERRAILSR